jgi:hypothetical protein
VKKFIEPALAMKEVGALRLWRVFGFCATFPGLVVWDLPT